MQLLRWPTAVARPMPPNVSEVDSPFTYRPHLIQKAALLRIFAHKSFKNTQKRYKDCDQHVQFKPRFTVSDNVPLDALC